jgi:hypothetical protein
MLPNSDYILAFQNYMARMYHEDEFSNVCKVYGYHLKTIIKTNETEGLAHHIGLATTQMEKLRSYLKRHDGLVLEHKADEEKIIAEEVGLRESSEPTFSSFDFESDDADKEIET